MNIFLTTGIFLKKYKKNTKKKSQKCISPYPFERKGDNIRSLVAILATRRTGNSFSRVALWYIKVSAATARVISQAKIT